MFKYKTFFVCILPILLLTPLRAAVIVIMPYLVILIAKWGKLSVSPIFYIWLYLMILSSCYGLIVATTEWANVLLSFWIIVPIMFLFYSHPRRVFSNMYIDNIIRNFTYVMAFIDIIGFICYLWYPMDDQYNIPYGTHFNGTHGIGLLNTFFCFYYMFLSPIKSISKYSLFWALFFFINFILCFYGSGVLALGGTMILFLIFNFKIKNILIALLLIAITVGVIAYSNPGNITNLSSKYEKYIIEAEVLPRKIIMYYNYINHVNTYPVSSIFVGVGPGGYNSRIAWLINNDSNNLFTKLLGHHMPVFHTSDTYPLWNKELYTIPFMDGSANKPFSSLVAIASEYGLISFLLFVFYCISRIVKSYRNMKNSSLYMGLFFMHVYMFISLLSDTWLESSEFLFYILFVLLIEIKIKNSGQESYSLRK